MMEIMMAKRIDLPQFQADVDKELRELTFP
jgi:hypothetical protein